MLTAALARWTCVPPRSSARPEPPIKSKIRIIALHPRIPIMARGRVQSTIVQNEAAGMWPRDAPQSPMARDGHARLTSLAPPRPRVGL